MSMPRSFLTSCASGARRCAVGFGALALLAGLGTAGSAAGAIDLAALARRGAGELPHFVGRAASTIVEVPLGSELPRRFVRVGTTASGAALGVLDVGGQSLLDVAASRPDLRLNWSPPLRLLLDRADGWTGASAFRNALNLSGKGVVLGIVDTGMDATHPDLLDENGRSRILWWLDFSRERAGKHPELEDALGCRTDPSDADAVPCAVLDTQDIDELCADADVSNDPHDLGGHGTHVASLAGGTGRSNTPARYVGVAPSAKYIVARVARKGGGIYDADVLRAASFVFERAEALFMPAVVNLSLGTDFGGHDGTTPVERGLQSLVGDEYPGRAIVVAAGNSAGLYTGLGTGTPEPLGVHTEVHVADDATALVPILTPPTSPGVTEGTVYIWLTLRPGDHLGLGVENRAGTLIEPVLPGKQGIVSGGELEVTVINGVTGTDATVPNGSYGAAVVIDGRWSSSEVFGLRLVGPASARIWIEGDGPLNPARSIGPLLPRAQKEGTINVPASAPDLIAVGATVNRTDFPDYAGETVSFAALGGVEAAAPGTAAFFSSAGPNALGGLKPDLVAPGANVVGALAAGEDPRAGSTGGLFDDQGLCAALGYAPSCFVVDDAHGVTGGTSMSAPIVSGAVALLFERDPTLTQGQVRALLQAGARRVRGDSNVEQQLGAGALDLGRTMQALDEGALERAPGKRTEILLSESFAHPDASWPLEGLVELRDDAGDIADGFDARRVSLSVSGASVVAPLTRQEPGLFHFAVVAPDGSGGRKLSLAVLFDGHPVAQRSLPIAVEHSLAGSLPVAQGACSLARPTRGTQGYVGFFALAAAHALKRRRARRAR